MPMLQPTGRRAFHNFDICFRNINPVLDKGQDPQHKLRNEDAYDVYPEDVPAIAQEGLKREWARQLRSPGGSLFKAIIRSNPCALYASIVFHFIEIAIQFVSPVMIDDLVQFIDAKDQSIYTGLFYATVFVLCPVIQSFAQCHFIVHCRRFGMRTQGATACMVFDKCLRLSQPAASSFGPGALVNIMQVDTVRFDFAFFHGNFMWSMPFMLVVGVALLYTRLGVAAFVPLVIMGLMHPVNNLIAKRLMKNSREVNQSRDNRVKLLTEVLHALKLVKMLAWENKVYSLVETKRQKEMVEVAVFRLWAVANGFVWQGMPIILPVITFGVFVTIGGDLKPGLVFSSLALLDLVRIPMNLFPQAMQVLVQVYVGLLRIDKLLRADESEQQIATDAEYKCEDTQGPEAVRMDRVKYSWAEAKQDANDDASNDAAGFCARFRNWRRRWQQHRQRRRENQERARPLMGVAIDDQRSVSSRSQISMAGLDGDADGNASVVDVSVEDATSKVTLALQLPASVSPFVIPRGKFVFVCGSVGSGKSTLISGLLNEVPLLQGHVHVAGPIAYCAQVPWIQHGTVKDNITFGDEFDADLFAQVVHACAITQDLEELQDGADTLIGERGINLSGGQKARISLARAAYKFKSTSTFLLDDPLSAVDAHVAKHLVKECLGSESGLLRNSTRILVTHQLQYMKEADLVVVLKDGEIVTCREPQDFSEKDLETYGLQVHQQPLPPPISLSRQASGASSTSSRSPTALTLTRSLSNTTDGCALRSDVCDGRVTVLNEEGATSQSDFQLGGSKLSPSQPKRRLLRSLSDGASRENGSAHVLKRLISAPATVREDASGNGNEAPATIEEDASMGASEDVQPEHGSASSVQHTGQANGTEQRATPSQSPGQQREEENESGALSLQVWCTYAKTMGPCLSAVVCLCFIMSNLLQMATSFWLANWSEEGKQMASRNFLASTLSDTVLAINHSLSSVVSTSGSVSDTFYRLGVYTALSLSGLIFFVVRMLVFRTASLQVSHSLHDKALWHVMRSPMSWLDTTPTGRIVNRFSQDLQKLDMEIMQSVSGFADSFVNLFISLIVILVFVPEILIILFPLLYIYNKVQRRFRETARELQRLSSLSRSPIYQGLDEAIVGASCIRAFRKQGLFQMQNAKRCALNLQLNFNIMCCNRWLALRLRSLGTVPVIVVVMGIVVESRMNWFGAKLTGAIAGIVLRYSLQLVDLLQGLLMSLTQTELSLVALERVSAYGHLSQEPALEEDGDKNLGVWPTVGCIEFRNVTMRYRVDLPPVLNGISFTIPGGTSVGVVGRTGAGKSSLIAALFRLAPLDGGNITIDGVDIGALGLHTMRRRLAIIPQDPVGFTGTLRFNLDPFEEREDEDLWCQLGKVQLQDFFRSKAEGLDFHLSAGGENLSVGQRQLVCVARAFLRGCRILILDEATASVDFQNDELIQEVLRHEVTTNKLTTITIAHRINTIMGSDNVLVMEKGRAAEFGPTAKLASNPKKKFYSFVHASETD